jgi:vancomycin resistance protein YoaR
MFKLIKVIVFFGLFLPAYSQATVFELPQTERAFKDLKQVEIIPQYEKFFSYPSVTFRPSFEDLYSAQILERELNTQSFVLDNSTAQQILQLQKKVEMPAQSAQMIVTGGRVTEFNPGQTGWSLDVRQLLLDFQNQTSNNISLPLFKSLPFFSLSDTNTLGINELVATGESDFSGSSANRIHNVKVGASKYNGLIVKPGEEFSFNKFLGDVDAANGFLPELVIKREGLVMEFGGGICQVSSTAFRAAMVAGFPITARRNHSFAVKYYAPQGTDATIYPGSQDMKFINDSQSNLLIITRMEGLKLYFDYYGSKDSRVVELSDPIQYDKKPDGSMKARWERRVTLNGQTTEQIFNSTYVSPNLYNKIETVQQASTPNPDSQVQEQVPSPEEQVVPVNNDGQN